MIKILHLSTSDIACDSRIIKSLQAAKDKGFCVKGIGICMDDAGKYVDSNTISKLNIISLKLYFRKLRKIPGSIRYFLVLIEYYIKAFKLALKDKPDLIHCNDEIPLALSVFVSLFTKSKIVYDAHELESEKNGLSNFKKKIIFNLEKMIWGKIDGLIVVSPSIKKWYEEKFPNIPTRIVLNAPVFNKLKTKNDKYFHNKYKLKDNDIVFLYIGAFLPGRGLELVAQEIGIMKDCHIVYLGYGSEKNKLLELSKKYNNIHIHDAVEHQQVVSLAQSADVGLCLIENISLSDYYCLPNKLFEYIFSSIPILASNFPDIRDVLSNYNIGVCVDLESNSIKSGVTLFVALFFAIIAIQVTGFDLSKTRAFGFGSGSNTSVNSRFDILLETGSAQLGYAPFLGNVNVAELTTGNAGRTLHNFIPNVMAELGLVGLILVFAILVYSFAVLIKNIKQAPSNPNGFGVAVINFWLLFVFIWLFLYANISVGKEWPVMWFYLGFAVSVFVFNDNSSRRTKCAVS